MQCLNCPHLKVEKDWYTKTYYEARCYEESVIHKDWKIAENGKYLYSGTSTYTGFSPDSLTEIESGLQSVMRQLNNQKRPPKWCPLLKAESEVDK